MIPSSGMDMEDSDYLYAFVNSMIELQIFTYYWWQYEELLVTTLNIRIVIKREGLKYG